jgi:hypothetical protein
MVPAAQKYFSTISGIKRLQHEEKFIVFTARRANPGLLPLSSLK